SSTHKKGIPAGVEQLETGILRARGEVYLALIRQEGVRHRRPSKVRLMIHRLQRGGTPGYQPQNQTQTQRRENYSRELTGHGVVSCLTKNNQGLLRGFQHGGCGTSHQELANPGVAIGAHHQNVDIVLVLVRVQRRLNITVTNSQGKDRKSVVEAREVDVEVLS